MSRAGRAHQARSVARLAAVQALYQMEVSGVGSEAVIREFADHRFDAVLGEAEPGDAGLDDNRLAPADEVYFARIVRGVIESQSAVDKAIVKRLASGWRLERIDATLRAILRAGAFELIGCAEAPTEVVIDEYVDVAKSFFHGPEAGFVNAALDGIAQDERA